MRLKLILFLLCAFFCAQFGQSQTKVDSLETEILEEKSDRKKIDLLIDLGNALSNKNDKIVAFEKIIPLATGELEVFKGSAYQGIGITHHNTGQRDSAIMNYNLALPFFIQGEKYISLGSIYNNLALLNHDHIDTAIFFAEMSLVNRKLSGDSLEVAHGEMLMGDLMDENGIYSSSMEHYLNAARIYDELDFIWGQINTYNNLAILYGTLEEFDKNIEYCQLTIDKILESGDSTKLGSAVSNLGNAYLKKGEYELSVKSHEQGIEIRINDTPYGLGESYYNIGDTYYHMGDYDTALDYLLKCHALFLQLNSPYVLFYSHNKLGAIYLAKGNITQAEKHLLKAHEYGLLSGALPDLLEIYESMSKLYDEKGQYKKAYDFHLLYTDVKDSIYSLESNRSIRDMSAKFDSELQGLKIEGLEKDGKIKDIELNAELVKSQAQNRIIWIIIFALIITIILALFAIKGFLDKKKANVVITAQKEEVEEKNQEIMDSITYAKRIQKAILPPAKLVKEYLGNSFILYKPKDIVAGDFYWMEQKEGKVLFAAADCTGHGVPGAMVSVICNNGLNRSVREYGLTDPGQILDKTREIVISEFEKSEEEVKDGMDVALCSLIGNELEYAGAHNPLWLIKKGADAVTEIKANKQPIGKFDNPTPYTTHKLTLEEGDTFYVFSDGYADQFGGEKGKKYKTANFKRLLISIQKSPIEEHLELIDKTFENWKGELEQLDDVCVIGVRV